MSERVIFLYEHKCFLKKFKRDGVYLILDERKMNEFNEFNFQMNFSTV